jgi:oligo-1,6-glucosidase
MERFWWKEAVVYQIYPRSFCDSNQDGIGDLKGILSKLDYLKYLGVNVLWLNPIYKSPNDDYGYDIADYQEIMREFGTMEDFDELLREAHQRGLKILLDLVVNHTSDEHRWFVESRSATDNPKRDFYFWRKGKEGKEPNNWMSYFTGSAWELDSKTDAYYLHLFSKKQPDLNWNNNEVRKSIYEMMNWWLKKGIDGFRMDVINFISKSTDLPDVRTDKPGYFDGQEYYCTGPREHEFLQEMNREVLSKYDIMTVGETGGITPDDALLYVGNDRKELNMVFQFDLNGIDTEENDSFISRPWKLSDFKQIINKWQTTLEGKGWNSNYLNNHDQPRMVSRFGNDKEYREESAKLLATLNFTLPGTPYIYQGEEIGMTNVTFETIDSYRDIGSLNYYNRHRELGDMTQEELMARIHKRSRDNARTPMQWNADKNAGFSASEPWINVNPNYKKINVEASVADSDSILHYYQNLIALRKNNPVLIYGNFEMLDAENEQIFAYSRTLENQKVLVLLNFSDQYATYMAAPGFRCTGVAIGNYSDNDSIFSQTMVLRPYEALVLRLLYE